MNELRGMMGQSKAAVFVLVYLLLRYGLGEYLENSLPNSVYLLEFAFVGVFLWFCPRKINWSIGLSSNKLPHFALTLLGGVAVYKAAGEFGIPIPFDFSQTELLLKLLLLAPILEELVYRYFFMESGRALGLGKKSLILSNALIFSLAHFYSYFFVPEAFHAFVLYQSAYTLIVGYLWARRIEDRSSMGEVMLLHALFNLGFFLGAQF